MYQCDKSARLCFAAFGTGFSPIASTRRAAGRAPGWRGDGQDLALLLPSPRSPRNDAGSRDQPVSRSPRRTAARCRPDAAADDRFDRGRDGWQERDVAASADRAAAWKMRGPGTWF